MCGPAGDYRRIEMPWLPDFFNAVELVRSQTRSAGRADPVTQYFSALQGGDTRALETVWPGQVVVYDPHAGEVKGHKQLQRFAAESHSWLAQRQARVETVAATYASGRAVMELIIHLNGDQAEVAWPVAVVAESPDDASVVFRTYCTQSVRDGQQHVRPPILKPGDVHPGDVVGRYQAAVAAGNTEAAVATFGPDGYYQGPVGPPDTHRGPAELRSFFTGLFSAGGSIDMHDCAVTDDGVRCGVEYICFRWGSHDLPPQAGLGVYERGPDGLLVAARMYDDVEAPALDGHQ
jgi:hypothetical protein